MNPTLLLNSPEDTLFAIISIFLAIQQVWMLMTGRIVPGRTVDRLMNSKNEQLKQKDATIKELVDIVGKQMVYGQASINAAKAIQEIPL